MHDSISFHLIQFNDACFGYHIQHAHYMLLVFGRHNLSLIFTSLFPQGSRKNLGRGEQVPISGKNNHMALKILKTPYLLIFGQKKGPWLSGTKCHVLESR